MLCHVQKFGALGNIPPLVWTTHPPLPSPQAGEGSGRGTGDPRSSIGWHGAGGGGGVQPEGPGAEGVVGLWGSGGSPGHMILHQPQGMSGSEVRESSVWE